MTDWALRWDQPDEIRLVRLVKSNAEYKVTFFPPGMVQRNQYRLGRDLAIEFLKGDRDQIRDWRNRGLIKKKSEGGWEPSEEWTSRVSNPVLTKVRE